VGTDLTTLSGNMIIVADVPDTSAAKYLLGSTFMWDTGLTTAGSGAILAFFGPGGSVGVSQDILDISSVCGTLGCFSGTFITGDLSSVSPTTLVLQDSFINGTFDPNLLAALGLPTTPTSYSGGLTANLIVTSGNCATATAESPCSGTWTSADLSLQPVPEPGTLTLLGTGLLTVAGFLRRKLRA